jgi:hypothetical protein
MGLDDNARLVNGTLPYDPEEDTEPYDAPPQAEPSGVYSSADTANDSAPWAARVTPVPASWFTDAPPARTWLLRDSRTPRCDGAFPLGKVGQIVAEGGAGKTMVLAQLAVSVATAAPWVGAMSVASPGRVLAILGEEEREEVQRRIYNAARSARARNPDEKALVTIPLAGLPSEMICRDGAGNPAEAPFLAWLRGYLASEGGWRLIIVDPLSRFAGLDAEKDNAQATRFVQALESLAEQTGASVLVAHHTNQSSRGAGARVTATSSRGVTALVDGVRWAMTLAVERIEGLDSDVAERLGEIVSIEFAKSNYSRKGAPILLRRDLDCGGALVPLDEADAEILGGARGNTGRAQKAAAKEDGIRRRDDADDDAARALIAERPNATVRELVAELKKRRACGGDRAHAAVVRVRGEA